MKIITTEKLPIWLWTDTIAVEEGAMEQIRNLANFPFAFKHIAIMPDVHQGYGMPIGGVLATKGVVIPNAVGVDIGCGVRAWKTGLEEEAFKPYLDKILNQIQRDIPTGFKHHQRPQESDIFDEAPVHIPIIAKELESARHQLGTLGGGNHFIELQRDGAGSVWVMLHSGSRNLGKKVADTYNRLAVDLNAKWRVPVPTEHQLAFLPLDTPEGQEYLAAMNFCLLFARENRKLMLGRIYEAVAKYFPDIRLFEVIDVHHNYAALENHFGEQVIVHRKGAVKAVGDVIIPGSMGSASYIARGLENPQSFRSCSHGAGRVMGRNEARKNISVDQVILEMRARDIRLFKSNKSDVAEECRQAYKDIDLVMENQKDLVKIKVKLFPLGVVKG